MSKNDDKNNEIKTRAIYLYVCYPPGLEDCSSKPGIVSRSSSRGDFCLYRLNTTKTKTTSRA